MSSLTQPIKREPKDRRRMRVFYLFFSLLWAAGIFAYAIGYWNVIEDAGGHLAMAQILFFLVILFVPMIVIWMPFFMTRAMRADGFAGPLGTRIGDSRKLDDIAVQLDIMAKKNDELSETILDVQARLGALTAHIGEQASQVKAAARGASLGAPTLPLHDPSAFDQDVTLKELGEILEFRDGFDDFSFDAIGISEHSKAGRLIARAKQIVEGLASEGIDLHLLRESFVDHEGWRALARGKRDASTQALALDEDRVAIKETRNLLKSYPEFQEMSLHYQKAFLELLAEDGQNATPKEIDALARSRGGIAFLLLGTAADTFRAQPRS